MPIESMLCLVLALRLTRVVIEAKSIAKPGCQESCGNVSIPYPFGIRSPSCYKNEDYAVSCEKESGRLRPYLTSCGLELLGVSPTGVVQVNNPVNSVNCCSKDGNQGTDLTASPFVFSVTYNRFTAIGCDNYAILVGDQGIIGGCLSTCRSGTKLQGCYGIDCCQTTVPTYLKSFDVFIHSVLHDGTSHRCRAAALVDQDWFNSVNLSYVQHKKHAPAVLEWGKDQGVCEIDESSISFSFCSSNGYCWTDLGNSHLCVCRQLSDQNPSGKISYVSGACQGCTYSNDFKCRLICLYTQSSHDCKCPRGYTKIDDVCYPPLYPPESILDKRAKVKIIIAECVSGLGLIVLVVATWWFYRIIKRRKDMKLKQKYFKRNGGLLLQQQLSSQDSSIEKIKIFSSNELEKATDHFNENRILGEGGQGTVYKGMLIDGRIVAIKRSKILDEKKADQFINEVVILSQINHRNVVKLLGCCLETEVPLLVYEFIPNGTLFDHLQDTSKEFLITWKMRLQIAIEVADAISYLHSAASTPIYHRDIKSMNILLDYKYKAKLSDFGTSKSIEVDQTHLTTKVQGTFGYVDPEYFRSSRFTDRSDVYSFGVVLIELLTGETPISAARSPRQKSLVTYFLLAVEEDHLLEIVDAQILKQAKEEDILAVAKLAERCVSIISKERPTMKAVAMELESIKKKVQCRHLRQRQKKAR